LDIPKNKNLIEEMLNSEDYEEPIKTFEYGSKYTLGIFHFECYIWATRMTINYVENKPIRKYIWKFKCSCGNLTDLISLDDLYYGVTLQNYKNVKNV
jgi:hypothetical protein